MLHQTQYCITPTVLETFWLCCIEPIINTLMRKLAQMVFSLHRGSESTAVEHRMKPLIEVYMTFP